MGSLIRVGLIVVVAGLALAGGLWTGQKFRQSQNADQVAAKVERLDWMDPFKPDWTADSFKVADARGKTLDLEPGKVSVVNFWATWCQPCLREMPDLIALAEDMKPKGVEVVAVSTMDVEPERVERFLDNNQWGAPVRFTFASDPDVLLPLGARGLPVTIVFGKDGKGRMQYFGPADWTSDEVKTYLVALTQE